MSIRMPVSAAVFAAAIGLSFVGGAQAQSVREQCSAKYQAAKSGGTLAGQTWNQFYSKCSADLKAAPAAAAAPAAPAATPAPAAPAANPLKPAAAPAAKPAAQAAAPAAAGAAVFPSAVSPKYANESAGKQRMHTCLDQYKANKAANANGGMKWIQKGGGYYSECNKRLGGGA